LAGGDRGNEGGQQHRCQPGEDATAAPDSVCTPRVCTPRVSASRVWGHH